MCCWQLVAVCLINYHIALIEGWKARTEGCDQRWCDVMFVDDNAAVEDGVQRWTLGRLDFHDNVRSLPFVRVRLCVQIWKAQKYVVHHNRRVSEPNVTI